MHLSKSIVFPNNFKVVVSFKSKIPIVLIGFSEDCVFKNYVSYNNEVWEDFLSVWEQVLNQYKLKKEGTFYFHITSEKSFWIKNEKDGSVSLSQGNLLHEECNHFVKLDKVQIRQLTSIMTSVSAHLHLIEKEHLSFKSMYRLIHEYVNKMRSRPMCENQSHCEIVNEMNFS